MRFSGPFAEIELRPGSLTAERVRTWDPEAVIAHLQPVRGDPLLVARLRSLLWEVGERSDSLAPTELVARAARLVAAGLIELLVHAREPRPSEPAERVSEWSVPQPLPPLDETTHWIELLVRREDGTPLPGVRCQITMPWGTVLTCTSNPLGVIRIDNLPAAGDCQVCFEEIEDEPEDEPEEPEWRLVEAFDDAEEVVEEVEEAS